MVNFFNSIKILGRPIKLDKNMLSPYKKGCRTPKEKHLKKVTTTPQRIKRKKENKNSQIDKYYSIIID